MEGFFRTTDEPYPPRVALTLYTSPNQSAFGDRCWGFHTVRGGIDFAEHCFRPRGVGVVEIRRASRSSHGILSCAGGAGSTRPSQSAIGQRGWDAHILRGGAALRDSRFHPRRVGVVVLQRDF